MKRKPIFLAAVTGALALVLTADAAAAHNWDGQRSNGAVPASPAGGGNVSRPVAPIAPQHVGGGGNMGGHFSAGRSSAPHAPFVAGSLPGRASGPMIYPRANSPGSVAPFRPATPNFAHAPITATQPWRSGYLPSGRFGWAGGRSFNPLPGGTGTGAGSFRAPNFPGNRAVPNFAATGSRPTRGPGTATTGGGLGTMPAIQRHLQSHGQNLQGWSANREQGLNTLHQQNAPRLEQFAQNRHALWGQLRGHDGDRARMAHERGDDWHKYRRDLWNYRSNRADEIRDRSRDAFDDLFTHDWWRRHHGRAFVLGTCSPWWWWNSCPWDTLVSFGNFGWETPIYYEYGANIIDDGQDSQVYVDGQPWGSSASYAQQVIEQANPPVAVEQPAPPPSADQPAEWQPFGVFALTQEEKGDAVMFFQLAVNRDGLISGAYTNTLTDETAPVSGAIDKATQRAAWHVGDKTNTVYETGAANLTQEVTPVLIHFDTQTTQTWLLVHLTSPELPAVPVAVDVAPPQ